MPLYSHSGYKPDIGLIPLQDLTDDFAHLFHSKVPLYSQTGYKNKLPLAPHKYSQDRLYACLV